MQKKNRVKTIIGICDAPNTTTFRYRIYNLARALENSAEFSLHYFYQSEINAIADYIPNISALLISRTPWTWEIQNIATVARAFGIPVIFDIDDYIFDLNAIPLLSSTLNVRLNSTHEYNHWAAHVGRFEMTANLADFFTATNPYLGEKLGHKFGKPFFCIENSLNQEQIAISQRICEVKKQAKSDGNFVIGYFSGTPSHINDFKIITSEIIRLLDNYPTMKLLVVGFMNFPQEINPYISAGRVITHPLVDFFELQILMAQVDVSIVPLVDNIFTNCKSELKFFEGAIVDVPTCATPIYSYSQSIQHEKTGFLCRQGQWYSTIAKIYEGKYDLKKICAGAKEYCLKHYGVSYLRKQAEAVYAQITSENKAD
ncbi:MAG: hypothetical protein LBM70_01890 [Victivallales bacterium]|jgi:hypothetical protein|nr:hypothetical protein [Victivallales bacterium]